MSKRREDRGGGRFAVQLGRRIAWFLFYIANLLVLCMVLIGIRYWQVNQLSDDAIPRIPAPSLPTPNGYTKLAEIGEQIVRAEDVSWAISRSKSPVRVFTAAERLQLIAENASLLVEARLALALPSRALPCRDFNQMILEPAKIRAVARLFALEGRVAEEQGQYERAMDAYLNAMALSDKVANGGILIHKLTGNACERMGRRPMIPLVDRLTASEARQAVACLETLMDNRVPLSANLTEEKWGTQASMTSMLRQYSVYELARFILDQNTCTLTASDSNGSDSGETSLWDGIQEARASVEMAGERGKTFLNCLNATKAEILQENAAYMDAVIERSQRPYQSHPAPIPEPKSILNQILLPVSEQAEHKEVDTRMQNALLLTKLALHVYRKEHGKYPSSLTDLVATDILKTVPVDPFAPTPTAALHYQRLPGGNANQDGYKLYSVGPDGRDDNGTPITPPYSNGTQKGDSERNSIGDFVLGINLD